MGLTQPVGESNVLYLSIVGGSMVQKSDADNPEAKKREFTKDDGSVVTKYEIHHRNLTGRIVGLDFKDSDFGEQFTITIQAGAEKAKLTMGTDSNYFSDFAKRLPNIDLNKDVTLNPYDMEKDNGKSARGISVKQGDEKITSAYWNGKKAVGGIPVVSEEDRKDYDKDDWKMFFIKVKKFLKKKVQALEIPEYKSFIGGQEELPKQEAASTSSSTPEEDDLPF